MWEVMTLNNMLLILAWEDKCNLCVSKACWSCGTHKSWVQGLLFYSGERLVGEMDLRDGSVKPISINDFKQLSFHLKT